MTAPAVAAVQFLQAAAIGAVLGLLYGFLTPLRPRHTALADSLFLAGTFAGWLWWAFALCRADPPVQGLLAMALGWLLCKHTLGAFLQPVFGLFWRLTARIWRLFLWPLKKISKIAKFCLHLVKNGLQWYGVNVGVCGKSPEEVSMDQLREFFSRIRLTYRRTNNLTKIAVIVAIVVCMTTLLALRYSMTTLENRTEDLREKAGLLEAENQALTDKIADLGSVKSTVQIAEEELDLVQPNAVVIKTEP